MQRKLDPYLLPRRVLNELNERFPSLLYHGTSSRALPSINRVGALLPSRELERRGLYFIGTTRGRQERSSTRLPEDLRDRVVSLIDRFPDAYHYADEDRLSHFKKELNAARSGGSNYFDNLQNELETTVRFAYQGNSIGWAETYAFSDILNFVRTIRKGIHRVESVEHFPVVVAIPAQLAPLLKDLDPKAREHRGEQVLLQIPAHKSFFIVPDDHVVRARELLPRYRHRIIPLSVFLAVARKKGAKIFSE